MSDLCLICGKPSDGGKFGGKWPICFECYTTADPEKVKAKDREMEERNAEPLVLLSRP